MVALTKQAKWITAAKDENGPQTPPRTNPWGDEDAKKKRTEPLSAGEGMPVFFRDFCLKKMPTAATVTASALGLFDLYCNGRRVGQMQEDGTVFDEMKPGNTVYTRHVLAYTYDLLPYLQPGENRVLFALSNGWYAGRISFDTYPDKHLCLWATLKLTAPDGTTENMMTDNTWRAGTDGQVLFADIWDGELQDMRRPSFAELSVPGAAVSCEGGVLETEGTGCAVVPQIGPTVRLRPELSPTAKTSVVWEGVLDNETDFGEVSVCQTMDGFAPLHLAAGQHLQIDLGQNMVGREYLRLQGKAGTHVTVRFAEMTNDSGSASRGNDGPRGSLYTANYRSAKARTEYILAGKEEGEVCTPLFGFCGFRYLEVTADADIDVQKACAVVLGSALPEVGEISTSDPEVNRLISNIRWGQRANYLSIPTDCPQRDERLGWTGDTQVFCRAAAYQADVSGFFRKWMQDVRDSQGENGYIPDVIPAVRIFAKSTAAAWGDAAVIVPWTMYQMYGDVTFITENLDCMNRYMDWLASRPGYTGAEERYLDWLAFDPTKGNYIAMAYYAYDATLMAKMCAATGHSAKAAHYAALACRVKEAFAEKHLGEDGLPLQQTQTAYLLALHFDLLPKESRDAAAAALRCKIKENGWRLSTGFVGTACLCQTLSECGLDDVAYSLLLQTECPSWLYSVRQGATTVWERWNSYTKESGFGDVGMNSFNHYAYGAVAEWMYRYMAGIDVDEAAPGFGHILLRPRPDTRKGEDLPPDQKRIAHVTASLALKGGCLKVRWEMSEAGQLTYTVTIPEGHWATLYLPLYGAHHYTENGVRTRAVPDADGYQKRVLPAGEYTFSVTGNL